MTDRSIVMLPVDTIGINRGTPLDSVATGMRRVDVDRPTDSCQACQRILPLYGQIIAVENKPMDMLVAIFKGFLVMLRDFVLGFIGSV